MRYLSKKHVNVEAVRGKERKSYSLNREKNIYAIVDSIKNNKVIKDRAILSCGYLDTGWDCAVYFRCESLKNKFNGWKKICSYILNFYLKYSCAFTLSKKD